MLHTETMEIHKSNITVMLVQTVGTVYYIYYHPPLVTMQTTPLIQELHDRYATCFH